MSPLDPQKRAILAGEYVLGTLSPAARATFARMMRDDPVLARLVDQWASRFAAIDATAPAVTPPARVWRRIAARTAPVAVRRSGAWLESLALWRAFAAGAVAVAAALLVIFAGGVMGPPAPPRVVAVLADKDGVPAWEVHEDRSRGNLVVQTVRTQPIDAQHAFELWVIADAKPLPLGVIPARADSTVAIPAASLPANGLALAVSLEPPGGSPTGLPTGPVLYQGRILND